jgi:NAD-dependent deacetylase
MVAGTDELLQEAASVLRGASYATALCGAGVSAESDIATFRDAGGLWERLDPAEVATTDALVRTLDERPEKLVSVFFELLDSFEGAEPNPGHRALARLEKVGILKTVITQNIDDLHREAGNTTLLEIHGNVFRMRCLKCGSKIQRDRKEVVREVREKLKAMSEYSLANLIALASPCPKCRSLTRPDVVMFGEAVQDLHQAYREARKSDVMLVLGTSGVVYPAADLPGQTKMAGGKLIVINPAEDAFSAYSDVYLPMKSGDALPAIVDRVMAMIVQ